MLILLWSVLCVTSAERIMQSRTYKKSHTHINADEQILEVQAIMGSTAHLPCDISTKQNDTALVLWYKEGVNVPIYSVDFRPNSTPQKWSDEGTLGMRANFLMDPPSHLAIENVGKAEEGAYRCRVDFPHSPTKNIEMRLKVIVPPQAIRITAGGRVVSLAGPYKEGETASLLCDADRGEPTSSLTWWHNGELIDDSWSVTADRSLVINSLEIKHLRRSDFGSAYTCQAKNNNITQPVTAQVVIDMSLKPLSVWIMNRDEPLSAGKRYHMKCESKGSRPAARITWWLNTSKFKQNISVVISKDGSSSTSTLLYIPAYNDGGKRLMCRAQSPAIPDDIIYDSIKLRVLFAPRLSIVLGKNLEAENLEEGSDLYLECHVKANPPVHSISWQHKGERLTTNRSLGIFITNNTVIQQNISRDTAGKYTCAAENTEGRTTSKPFLLTVNYAPVCSRDQQWIYGVSLQETVSIFCKVDAQPKTLTFFWTFNNTNEKRTVSYSDVSVNLTTSKVIYKPEVNLDYGTLLCLASNSIGRQRVPCVFHIVQAAKPKSPKNCSIEKETKHSLYITCKEDNSDGMPQIFILELYDLSSHNLLMNTSQLTPNFSVTAIPHQATGPRLIYIYSANAKGRSPFVALQTSNSINSKQETGMFSLKSLSPVLCLLLGLVGCLIVLAVAVMLWLRVVTERSKSKNIYHIKTTPQQQPEEKHPDIIPHTVDDGEIWNTDVRTTNLYINQNTLIQPEASNIGDGTTAEVEPSHESAV